MSFAQFESGFPAVYVSGDWTDPAVVAADIHETTEATYLAGLTFTIYLWEGRGDTNDYAILSVVAGVGAFTRAFDSAPAVGDYAFIVGVTFA